MLCVMCGLLAVMYASFVHAGPVSLSWVEDFADDPVAAERFIVPDDHDPSRFSYDGSEQRLTVHFDAFETTAWYVRPLDAEGSLTLGLCDAYEFTVTFRILSDGFYADPFQFAQIGWGLVNSQTTGEDRSGGAGPTFAFDTIAFDYFPNVSPTFGGPTLGSTLVHSDTGAGYFSAIEFPFGSESQLDAHLGDDLILLDTEYAAQVSYNPASRVVTLRILHDGVPLNINADGSGGPGGPDGDPTTIQTVLFMDTPFEVDSFALTAWQDTFNPFDSSVIADVEISRIEFAALPWQSGDVNFDGVVDGLDVAPLVDAILNGPGHDCFLQRADFDEDGEVTLDDVEGFVAALLGA